MSLVWPVPWVELTDGQVVLRLVSFDDADELTAACQDADTVRFTTIPQNYTRSMAVGFIEKCLAPGGDVYWVFEDATVPGRFAGAIELRLDNLDANAVSVGYHTAPWARGRGLVTGALSLVVEHAFAHGVHRCELRAYAHNAASRRVAEKAGFALEGLLGDAALQHGSYVDVAVYSKLASTSS